MTIDLKGFEKDLHVKFIKKLSEASGEFCCTI